MNDQQLISGLAALPDEDLHVDLDAVVATVKSRRRRRHAVTTAALTTTVLTAGLIVVIGHPGGAPLPPPPPAVPGNWTVRSSDTQWVSLSSVAVVSASDVWTTGVTGEPDPGGVGLRERGRVEHWDGQRWTRFDLPDGHHPFDLAAIASGDVWVVGRVATSGPTARPFAMHWDGLGWRDVPVPPQGSNSYLDSVAVVSANDIWAVGPTPSLDAGPLLVRWDGQRWTTVTLPDAPAGPVSLDFVSARGADDVWAVGRSDSHPLIAHFVGSGWSWIPATVDGRVLPKLRGVVALGPDDVWGVSDTGFFRWDGRVWREAPLPAELDGRYATFAPDGAGGLFVAGYRLMCQNVPCPNGGPDARAYFRVAHWNGTAWRLVSPPVDGPGMFQDLDTARDGSGVWAVGLRMDASNFDRWIVASRPLLR
ncbi:MAG TPA: hypothetical protein VFV67_32230 [Actinophytocola sp.]|uniref:hypothetical protein n=1 Tax=Actinophytocola sp. TaxID=1872138 RepID=UPI002DB868D0|nr:hypothetical protein [Actinophytocola sp.]HEU5475335.1 hypothetical protein [Actinophytocola sp.]